jgi:hypothetical protein
MKTQLFAQHVGVDGIRLLICAGSSTALTVDQETALHFAEDIMAAVALALAARPLERTRRQCLGCLRDAEQCSCPEVGCNVCASFGQACCSAHKQAVRS